jgi:hypothetical protein
MEQYEFLVEPCRLGVPSSASKTTSEPTVHSVQTVHTYCVKISTMSPRSTIGCI